MRIANKPLTYGKRSWGTASDQYWYSHELSITSVRRSVKNSVVYSCHADRRNFGEFTPRLDIFCFRLNRTSYDPCDTETSFDAASAVSCTLQRESSGFFPSTDRFSAPAVASVGLPFPGEFFGGSQVGDRGVIGTCTLDLTGEFLPRRRPRGASGYFPGLGNSVRFLDHSIRNFMTLDRQASSAESFTITT